MTIKLDGTFGIDQSEITGATTLPIGTEQQRPNSPVAGMIRFNIDENLFEGYDGTEWNEIGAGPELELDGGFANSVYLTNQLVDGGTASG
jgi:hypothetical protein